MSNITRIEGSLEEIAPILFNRFVDIEALGPGAPGGRRKTDDLEALEAKAKLRVYRADDGQVVWPAWNLKVALLDGARLTGLKVGRKSAVPYIKGTVFFDRDPTFGVTEPDRIHSCVGKIPPRTGSAVVLRRPQLDPGWTLRFVLRATPGAPPPDDLKLVLEAAGFLSGLGAWRPEYGRFTVASWNVRT